MTRFVDRGAIFAGWVGLGTAVVIVIAFALILTIQTVVFVLAMPVGVLIGWYANMRAERRRPRGRALVNALWAGGMAGLTLAVFYVGIRLLFIYADTGYPDFNRSDPQSGQSIPPFCQTGPACTYQRYLAAGRAAELEAVGVSDSAAFGRFILAEQVGGGVLLFVLTLGGAAVAGGWRAIGPVGAAASPDTAAIRSPTKP